MSRHAVAVRHLGFEDLGLIAPILADQGYETITQSVLKEWLEQLQLAE